MSTYVHAKICRLGRRSELRLDSCRHLFLVTRKRNWRRRRRVARRRIYRLHTRHGAELPRLLTHVARGLARSRQCRPKRQRWRRIGVAHRTASIQRRIRRHILEQRLRGGCVPWPPSGVVCRLRRRRKSRRSDTRSRRAVGPPAGSRVQGLPFPAVRTPGARVRGAHQFHRWRLLSRRHARRRRLAIFLFRRRRYKRSNLCCS